MIGVANRPTELSKSVLTYLPLRLHVIQPDQPIRLDMIKHFMLENSTDLSDDQLVALVEHTESLSGFEMAALMSYCSTAPLREVHMQQNANELELDQIRPIEFDDFLRALRNIRAIVESDKTSEWANYFRSQTDH